MKATKKLIEVALPLEAINKAAEITRLASEGGQPNPGQAALFGTPRSKPWPRARRWS